MDWLAIDADVHRNPKVWKLADQLGVSIAAAVGHLVGVLGHLARHGDERGQLGDLSDDLLETVACWRGEPGRFAAAFRPLFCEEDGTMHGWAERNGTAIAYARRERERKSQERRELAAAKAAAKAAARALSGGPADGPADSPADGPADAARTVLRNGREDRHDRHTHLTTSPDAPVGARKKRENGALTKPSWVPDAVQRWARWVGAATHGRMGAALKPAVDLYGAEAVLEAIERFGQHREARRDTGDTRLPGLPQFVAEIRSYIPSTMLKPTLVRSA